MTFEFEHTVTEFQNEFRQINFKYEGRSAILVLPNTAHNGKWLLKTEYFGAFPSFEVEMLRRGYAVAYIRNENRWGMKSDTDMQYSFACFLHEKLSFSKKCLPVGMSCGGMFAIKLAARYPDITAAIYIDAPVVDLLSCPLNVTGSHNSEPAMQGEMLNALGKTRDEMAKYRDHPYDLIPKLIENRIPVFMVAGDSDTIVPYAENGAWLKKAYDESGLECELVLKAGCDHHPHGLEDNTPIIRFAEKYY